MEIRSVPDDEVMQMFYLGTQAFGFGSRDAGFLTDPNREPRANYGVYDEDGLQAIVRVNPYQTYIGETLVPMGGLAGVSCLPAKRGKGYIGKALDYSLAQMKEQGQAVSTLFPFAWDFYRGYGWEWIGLDREYTVPGEICKPDPNTENIRAYKPEDRDTILATYRQVAIQYRGMIDRTPQHWNRYLDDAEKQFTYTYLYEQHGVCEGYLTYRGGNGDKTDLNEFVCTTARAQRAFLGFLRRLSMQTKKFAWHGPADDTLFAPYYHWDIETKIAPKCMGRVVDIAQALPALKPHGSGQVTFAVRDDHAPWNAGTWQVEFEAGHIAVQKTDAAPQVTLDIQALSQAYFGTPDVPQIRRGDRLTVHDEAGYTAFAALFAGPPCWMNDDF